MCKSYAMTCAMMPTQSISDDGDAGLNNKCDVRMR